MWGKVLEFDIDLIANTIDEVSEFVKHTGQWVIEAERRRLKDEVNRIMKNAAFIDHCWIKRQEEIVGVVRIRDTTFYSLGLDPKLTDEEIDMILDVIIRDISYWKPSEIEASVHERYVPFLERKGFERKFSREQMDVNIDKVRGLKRLEGVKFKSLNWKEKNKYREMFVDAYTGTIDEKIEMFTPLNANFILEIIKSEEFGEVLKDLSVFIEENGEYVGGVICTYFEESIFVAIIGVRKAYQGKGLGRGILTEVMERAKQIGKFEKISLWVTTENEAARSLYLSMGFKPKIKVYALRKQINYPVET
ncbi:MAG: GNAT family N-acetyltransferase [Methanobacteriota archaeon]|nr:MAG: GNAT family N-acetyltransferase [Euryarchaeota archaeon]